MFSDISVHCGTGGFFKMIYSLELFVVKASRVLQDFVFIIIMRQDFQALEHVSFVDEFFMTASEHQNI